MIIEDWKENLKNNIVTADMMNAVLTSVSLQAKKLKIEKGMEKTL